MAIVFPQAPAIDEPALARRLAKIAASPLSGAAGQLAGVAVDALSYTVPQEIWYSTLDALLDNRLLASARAQAWRYLLCEGDRGVGEIEIGPNSADAGRPFLAVHEGDAAQATIEALTFAESLPEAAAQDLEARFLRVPAMNFAAVWLHGGAQDLLIPVIGHGDILPPRHAYTEAKVTGALRERAERARHAPEPRRGRP